MATYGYSVLPVTVEATLDVDSDIDLTDAYDTILVDCTSGRVTVTLPLVLSAPFKRLRIKKIDATSNPVVVKPAQGDELDGADEWLINFQYDAMVIVSDNSHGWWQV